MTGIQAGSIFVDDAAGRYINILISRAATSGSSVDIDVEEALYDFSNYVKPSYIGTEESLTIKVGARRLNRPEMGITGGRMKLTR